MKRFIQIAFSVAFLIGLTVSCDKTTDTNNVNPVNVPAFIRTMQMKVNDTVQYNYAFTYNSNQKLSHLELAVSIGASNYGVYLSSTYLADTAVNVISYDAATDTVVERDHYILGASGLAIKKDVILNGSYASHSFYTYDSNGYLIGDSTVNLITPVLRTITNYTIASDGNISSKSVKSVTASGSATLVTTYSFNTAHANTIGNLNQGVKYAGMQNVNLLASWITSPAPPAGPATLNYTYQFDTNNRVFRMTTSDGTIYTYSYY